MPFCRGVLHRHAQLKERCVLATVRLPHLLLLPKPHVAVGVVSSGQASGKL